VVVLEKGSEPGAHIISGAVMDPRALTELFPDWKERGAPLNQPVTEDEVYFLSEKTAARARPTGCCPTACTTTATTSSAWARWPSGWPNRPKHWAWRSSPALPPPKCCTPTMAACAAWPPAMPASARMASRTAASSSAWNCCGKYTVFAEGARGHLGKQLIARYKLDAGRNAQTYALGVKELWEIDPAKAKPGLVVHTAGWPMDEQSYGGGFLYHLEGNRVTLGLVTGLDYQNPWLSPFEEMQRWKTHPVIRAHIEGGTRIGYGARAICAGGLLSLPKLVFPGGALVGCDAGTLNAARIKGSHAAIKTGMLAAEAAAAALKAGRSHDELADYPKAFEQPAGCTKNWRRPRTSSSGSSRATPWAR
jgi:electron-transferring-flavoprotein dehydrogenase